MTTLNTLEKALEAATPAPWALGESGTIYKPVYVPVLTDLDTGKTRHREVEWNEHADALVTVLAVNHLPSLVRVARAAEAWLQAESHNFNSVLRREAREALRSALAALEGGEK
jgi:hypothetical protein